MSSTLNIDQKSGVKAIEDNRLVVVEGGPGTGKSFMIRSLLGRPDFGPTLVVAIANAALAHYPHQYTANLAQVKARLGRKRIGRATDPLGKFLFAVSVGRPVLLVIDEAFLMSSKDLAELNTLLCVLRRSKTLPFGGVRRLVLVGDPGQLKPIDGEPISSYSLFPSFKSVKLTTNRRFDDPEYATLLTNVGTLLQKTEAGSVDRPEAEPSGQLFERFVRGIKRDPVPGATLIGWRRTDVAAATAQTNGIKLIPSKLGKAASNRDRETTIVSKGDAVRIKTNPKVKETGTSLTPESEMVYNGKIAIFDGVVDAEGNDVVEEHVEVGPDRLIRLVIGSEVVVLEPSRPYSGLAPIAGHVVQIESARGMTVVSAQGSTLPNGIHFVAAERIKVPAHQLLVALQRVPSPDLASVSKNVDGIRWPKRRKIIKS
jgi:hypothetical protein